MAKAAWQRQDWQYRLELSKLCYHSRWWLMRAGYRTCFHTLYDEKKCLYISMYIFVYIYAYTFVYICIHLCIYLYKCIHVYIYMYIHIYINVYMYIYCCIVARTTWLPVLWKYKRRPFSEAERNRNTEAEISVSSRLISDVTPTPTAWDL